jgi:hypothetical protein
MPEHSRLMASLGEGVKASLVEIGLVTEPVFSVRQLVALR